MPDWVGGFDDFLGRCDGLAVGQRGLTPAALSVGPTPPLLDDAV